MNKRGEGHTLILVALLIVVIIIGAAYLGYIPTGTNGGTPTPGGTNPPADRASCSDTSNTMTLGPVKYYLTPGNTTAESSRVFVDGVDQGTKADGTTQTIGFQKKVDILYGYGSNAAYTNKLQFYSPCEPFSTSQIGPDAANLLIADPAVTISAFNSDTGNKNAGTGLDNETIAAGESGGFDISFASADKQGISGSTETICLGQNLKTSDNSATCKTTQVGKVHVYVELNGTMYDQSKTLLGGASPVSRGSKPSWMSLANVDDEIVEFQMTGCPISPKSACDTKALGALGRLSISAKTGINPGTSGGSTQNAAAVGAGDPKVTLAYENYYIDTRTGMIGFSIQKDDGTVASTGIESSQSFYLSVD